MCVQTFLCQLWQDLHRQNWKEVCSQITGTQDWSEIQNRTHIHQKPSCIKFNRTQQISSHRPRNSREPCHQSVSSDIDWQRAIAFYQIWIKEAIHIRKEGQQAINRDKGSYQLSMHTTAFLTRRLAVVSRTGRTEYQLLLMKASDRGRNVKF